MKRLQNSTSITISFPFIMQVRSLLDFPSSIQHRCVQNLITLSTLVCNAYANCRWREMVQYSATYSCLSRRKASRRKSSRRKTRHRRISWPFAAFNFREMVRHAQENNATRSLRTLSSPGGERYRGRIVVHDMASNRRSRSWTGMLALPLDL
jgi:hypothetical protein